MTTSPFIPRGAPYTFERIDQGVDFRTKPGGPIIAPWPGTVTIARPNPGGFGTHYALIRFTGGPHKGEQWYIGHAMATVTGRVRAGDVIARTGRGSESWMGNAKGIPGHVEIGRWPPGSMSAGGAVRGIVEGGPGPRVQQGSVGAQSFVGATADGSADTTGGGLAAFAADPAGTIVKALLDPFEKNATRMLMYLVLVAGGIALAALGATRAADTHPGKPPLKLALKGL